MYFALAFMLGISFTTVTTSWASIEGRPDLTAFACEPILTNNADRIIVQNTILSIIMEYRLRGDLSSPRLHRLEELFESRNPTRSFKWSMDKLVLLDPGFEFRRAYYSARLDYEQVYLTVLDDMLQRQDEREKLIESLKKSLFSELFSIAAGENPKFPGHPIQPSAALVEIRKIYLNQNGRDLAAAALMHYIRFKDFPDDFIQAVRTYVSQHEAP